MLQQEKNNRLTWDAFPVGALFLEVVQVGLVRVLCHQFVAMG